MYMGTNFIKQILKSKCDLLKIKLKMVLTLKSLLAIYYFKESVVKKLLLHNIKYKYLS